MDITAPQIQPGMSQEDMQKALQDSYKQTILQTQANLKANADLINARRAKLFGAGSGTNLTPEQGAKVGMLAQMIEKNPIILEPIIGFAVVLTKANMENMAALASNPNVIMEFNKWLRDQGIIKDPPPAQTQGQST